jgi:hypothetical protein
MSSLERSKVIEVLLKEYMHKKWSI